MIFNKKNRGFTLVEVLVALLVFTLGLMGMASLMVVSVKTNQSAFLRTQASFLAQAMADRMRINMQQINAYNGSYSLATAGSDPCAGGLACSPSGLVARDRAVWSRQLVDSLPNATANIFCNGVVLGSVALLGTAPYQGTCTMTIQWNEATLQRGENSAAPPPAEAELQTFAWVFQP